MSSVEKVAISSGSKTASWAALRTRTCAEVSASAWSSVNAFICVVLRAMIWLGVRLLIARSSALSCSSVRPMMAVCEMALSWREPRTWISSASSAATCFEEKALSCEVVSEATSSVDQLWMAAVESALIWLMLKEETIDVIGKILRK